MTSPTASKTTTSDARSSQLNSGRGTSGSQWIWCSRHRNLASGRCSAAATVAIVPSAPQFLQPLKLDRMILGQIGKDIGYGRLQQIGRNHPEDGSRHGSTGVVGQEINGQPLRFRKCQQLIDKSVGIRQGQR